MTDVPLLMSLLLLLPCLLLLVPHHFLLLLSSGLALPRCYPPLCPLLHNATCDIAPICPRHNLPTLHRIHAEALGCAAHYTLGYHWHCLPTSPKCPARVPATGSGTCLTLHLTRTVHTTHPTAHIIYDAGHCLPMLRSCLRCTSFVPFEPGLGIISYEGGR